MKKNGRFRWFATVLLPCAWAPLHAQPAVFNVLHEFTAGAGFDQTNADGAYPEGGLALSGNALCGTTYNGGKAGLGAVFRVNTNGAAFTNVHSFAATSPGTGTNKGGSNPDGGLVISGNVLYGTAYSAGKTGSGTVFTLNADGQNFQSLYNFSFQVYSPSIGTFTNGDGSLPEGNLVLSGNTLYGIASLGGDAGQGAVFRVNTDGSSFTNLHSFSADDAGTNSDGAEPQNGLVLAGGTLYGTASAGGNAGSGTVFRVNIDGSGFSNLYSFTSNDTGTNSDGASPQGELVLSGGVLYGTATYGGLAGYGTVFALDTNGGDFSNLHDFSATSGFPATNSDGAYPEAGLVLTNNTLYGTAESGGAASGGTVFALQTNGAGFIDLQDFPYGAEPQAGLILSGNALYGTTSTGGAAGNGTVFRVVLPPYTMPYVTTNPASQYAVAGGSPALQVAAVGAGTLAYQWFFNGRKVTGATAGALTLENYKAANAGSYNVVVTNAFGSATSAVAVVSTVIPPRVTGQPASQRAPTNGNATFSVKAAGAPLAYQWLFDNQPLFGETNAQLVLQMVDGGDAGTYSAIVSNAASQVTSAAALLTVTPETSKPSVSILSPKPNSRADFPTLSGTASDHDGVMAVNYVLTNAYGVSSGQADLFGSSESAPNWDIFTSSFAPGANVLSVQSVNYSGLVSPMAEVAFFYLEATNFQLAIEPEGFGVVTGAASIKGDTVPSDGALLNIGESYTLTARPANNWLLLNWMTNNVIAGTGNTFAFVMQPNLSVTAYFTSNAFVGAAARYDGIFYPSPPQTATVSNAGLIANLQLKTNGVYSGKLYLAGTAQTLAGTFDAAGQAIESLGRNLTLELSLLSASAPFQITGWVSNASGWVSTNLNLYAAAANPDDAANYTALLQLETNDPALPPDFSYALATNVAGMIHSGGALSDGTPFTSLLEPLNQLNSVPIYAGLYQNKGLLLGMLNLDELAGNLIWVKPHLPKAAYYPAGFAGILGAQISPWSNSPAALNNLFAGGAELTISGGNLTGGLDGVAQLSTNKTSLLVNTTPAVAGGSINRANGLMTLVFTNGGTRITAAGAVLQNANQGGGFFLGATNAGSITLAPLVR